MPVVASEAVVLRTWPVHEADLVVSFFTRDYGRLKGIAKSALKSRKRFGGALEPMTLARAFFAARPRQELVRLDQLEIVRSPLSGPVDAVQLAVLSFYAELIDEALPEHDPQDAVFRLLVSVLERTAPPNPGMPLTYFMLWITRLMGLLPDLGRCIVCGQPLHAAAVVETAISNEPSCDCPETAPLSSAASAAGAGSSPRRLTAAFFNACSDGLLCQLHCTAAATALSFDSWQLAQRMLRAPVAVFAAEPWPRRRAQDLRRFLLQILERHLERKLRSAEALARLGA